MALDLLKRSEAGSPITQTQHDANLTAIETAVNGIDPDPGANRTSSFTLAAANANALLVCTAAITVTVPAAATLGTKFSCDILADGATVTIDGPGATNVSVATGEIVSVFVANGKVWAAKGTLTRID